MFSLDIKKVIKTQENIFNVLKKAKANDRLSHAYLFYGEEGTGKKEMADLVNTSVSQTVTRSLFTSITTFFTVLALYIFGVADIKAFALPLMVGVICGTYSSICIASPVWYDLKMNIKKSEKN